MRWCPTLRLSERYSPLGFKRHEVALDRILNSLRLYRAMSYQLKKPKLSAHRPLLQPEDLLPPFHLSQRENNRKRPLSDSSCPNNNKQSTPEPPPIECVCCPVPSVFPNCASKRTPPDLQCMKRPDNPKKNNKIWKSTKRDHCPLPLT